MELEAGRFKSAEKATGRRIIKIDKAEVSLIAMKNENRVEEKDTIIEQEKGLDTLEINVNLEEMEGAVDRKNHFK